MFKFLKKLKLKSKTAKNPLVMFNKEPKFLKRLTREKKLKKINKRIFTKNLNFGFYKKINKYIALSIILALVLLVFFLMFFTDIFTIKKITLIEGTEISENQHISKYTDVLKNRHIILTDMDSLEQTLKNNIKNLNKVTILKKYPHTLVIKFESYKEKANIVNIIGAQEIRKNFIINESGVLTSEKTVNSQLPHLNIKSARAFNVGDQILKTDQLNYILEAKNYFEQKMNIKITESTILTAPRELRMQSERGFQVWLDMSYDYKEQINKLKNAVPKINPYQQQYEYIDLRIKSAEGQKIIYK